MQASYGSAKVEQLIITHHGLALEEVVSGPIHGFTLFSRQSAHGGAAPNTGGNVAAKTGILFRELSTTVPVALAYPAGA
jgi:hypothetical protein